MLNKSIKKEKLNTRKRDLGLDYNSFDLEIQKLISLYYNDQISFENLSYGLQVHIADLKSNLQMMGITQDQFIRLLKDKKIQFKSNSGFFTKLKRVFAKDKEILDLFSKINSVPELKAVLSPIYISSNYPTIIIIQDIHAGDKLYTKEEIDAYVAQGGKRFELDERWTVEKKQLKILKEKFGIDFVGLEGWPGEEVYRKYGSKMLGGEELLVKYFAENQLKCVSLDSFDTMKKVIDVYCYLFIELDQFKYLQNSEMQNVLFECYDVLENKKEKLEMNEFLSKFENVIKEENMPVVEIAKNCIAFLKMFLRFQENQIESIEDFEKKFNEYYDYIVREYKDQDFAELQTKYVEHARDVYGVEQMLKAMNGKNKKIGVMVFGRAHTQGLISELKKQTGNKINIYVAK